jgi:hypothetical protein
VASIGRATLKIASDIISERTAIARERCRVRGVIGQQIRQQCPCHPPCFLRRIPTRVLERVCEDGDAGDAFLAVFTNGKVTEDKVGPHGDLLAEFPYLGPPHNA